RWRARPGGRRVLPLGRRPGASGRGLSVPSDQSGLARPTRVTRRIPDACYHRRALKLQEFHSKTLLRRAGLPVPPWSVASTPAEARAEAEAYLREGAGSVVIKAQVLAGGRGKAGGVKLANTPDEAEQV